MWLSSSYTEVRQDCHRPVYVGSTVRIVWVGQGGSGPVYVGSRV